MICYSDHWFLLHRKALSNALICDLAYASRFLVIVLGSGVSWERTGDLVKWSIVLGLPWAISKKLAEKPYAGVMSGASMLMVCALIRVVFPQG